MKQYKQWLIAIYIATTLYMFGFPGLTPVNLVSIAALNLCAFYLFDRILIKMKESAEKKEE